VAPVADVSVDGGVSRGVPVAPSTPPLGVDGVAVGLRQRLALDAVVVMAIVLFSLIIFRFVDQMQNRLKRQNRELRCARHRPDYTDPSRLISCAS